MEHQSATSSPHNTKPPRRRSSTNFAHPQIKKQQQFQKKTSSVPIHKSEANPYYIPFATRHEHLSQSLAAMNNPLNKTRKKFYMAVCGKAPSSYEPDMKSIKLCVDSKNVIQHECTSPYNPASASVVIRCVEDTSDNKLFVV